MRCGSFWSVTFFLFLFGLKWGLKILNFFLIIFRVCMHFVETFIKGHLSKFINWVISLSLIVSFSNFFILENGVFSNVLPFCIWRLINIHNVYNDKFILNKSRSLLREVFNYLLYKRFKLLDTWINYTLFNWYL